ncbi:MAG: AbrB/MazE/SpoVT family DNA-binding domain-containing protein [Actinomycetota bacterium]|nr:AbrB/MazE/SpoVT family DNA-binding domain-containing protein [Actinomycetota bacterium]
MKTTIDAAGRVVIPKVLRDELGLTGGKEVEVSLRDGHLELEPVSVPMHLVERGGVLMAEPDAPIPPLTVEQVRETLDRVRR